MMSFPFFSTMEANLPSPLRLLAPFRIYLFIAEWHIYLSIKILSPLAANECAGSILV